MEDKTKAAIEARGLLYREHNSGLDTAYIRNEDVEEVLDCIELAYIAGEMHNAEEVERLKSFIIEIGVRAQVILPVEEQHLQMWEDQFNVNKSDWLDRFHKLTDNECLIAKAKDNLK